MKIRGAITNGGRAMLGPGEYIPDVTEGITRVEDLPKPRIAHRSRNYPARRCRRCRRRVQQLAVRLVAEDGLPYQAASWHLWRDHRVFVPYATIQNWVEAAGGKKD